MTYVTGNKLNHGTTKYMKYMTTCILWIQILNSTILLDISLIILITRSIPHACSNAYVVLNYTESTWLEILQISTPMTIVLTMNPTYS